MDKLTPHRRFEEFWKRIWFAFFDLILAKPDTARRLDLTKAPLRVIYLRHDRLGDAIVSSGLLRALGTLAPRVQVDVLASARNVELFRRYPYIQNVHLYDRRRPASLLALAWRLLRGHYDVVIDPVLTKRSMTSLLLMLATRARCRMGFAGCGTEGLTYLIEGRTQHDYVVELLSRFAEPFGINSEDQDWRPEIPLIADEREWAKKTWTSVAHPGQRRLLLNVSGGHHFREWPAERMVALIRELQRQSRDIAILVVGAPTAAEKMQEIAEAGGVACVATPEIGMIIGLVALGDLVFTPDTSIAHMAAAFRKPAVVMYLRETASQWGHPDTGGSNLESEGYTLEELPLEPVAAAVARMLDAVPA
jgi:ADP-heptose:LPS heptosyltransferase